jgi:hypothetical protein
MGKIISYFFLLFNKYITWTDLKDGTVFPANYYREELVKYRFNRSIGVWFYVQVATQTSSLCTYPTLNYPNLSPHC